MLEFWSIVAALRPQTARRFLERFERAPPVAHDELDERFEGAAVQVDLESLLALEAEAIICEVAASDGLPALSLIDRFFALPGGVGLLEGRPVAWLPAERRERLEDGWRRLLRGSAGKAAMAACVAPHLAGREADMVAVERAAESLGRVLASARHQRLDVLLVCGARA